MLGCCRGGGFGVLGFEGVYGCEFHGFRVLGYTGLGFTDILGSWVKAATAG